MTRVPEHPLPGKIVTVKATAPTDVQRQVLADINRQVDELGRQQRR